MPSARSRSSMRSPSVAPEPARDRANDGARVAVRPHGPPARSSGCPARPTPASSRSTAFTPTSARRSSARAHFNERFAELVAREAALLRAQDAALVVADAPPLACAAADDAGIPAVVCANFTWDWIYRDYREQPGVTELVAAIGDTYARASACVADAGPRRLRDDPERSSTSLRRAARPCPGRPALRTAAARAAGGAAARAGLVRRLRPAPASARPSRLPARLGRRRVVARRGSRRRCRPAFTTFARTRCTTPACATRISSAPSTSSSPSRGTASSRTAWPTARRCSTRRADGFAEYEVMVREMPRLLRCRCLELRRVRRRPMERRTAASWRQLPPPPEQPRVDGAEVVAAMIAEPAQCALTVVTSDQIRGKFTFSIDIGWRSACARNAGRSRSALKPM